MILFTWGDTYLPLKNMKMGMNYSETFQNVGFQDGDILLRADNEELERFGSDSFRKVVEAKTVTVLRDGRETVISIPEDMMQRCMRDGKGFADPLRIPMVVRELPDKNAPAALAGMQPKDSVVAINGVATPTFYDASGLLSENKGEEVTVDFYRNRPVGVLDHEDGLGRENWRSGDVAYGSLSDRDPRIRLFRVVPRRY